MTSLQKNNQNAGLKVLRMMTGFTARFIIPGFLLLLLAGCPVEQEFNQAGFGDRTQPPANTNNAVEYSANNRGGKLIERFNQFDQNGDGILTSEEVKRPRLFNKFDANADGSITLQEAEDYVRNRRSSSSYRNNNNPERRGFENAPPVRSTADPVYTSVTPYDYSESDLADDLKNNSSPEFRQPSDQGRYTGDSDNSNKRGVKLVERFRKLDRNGDGVLTREEVKRPDLFERLDQNADGSVTLEEARSYARSRRQSSRNNKVSRSKPSGNFQNPGIVLASASLSLPLDTVDAIDDAPDARNTASGMNQTLNVRYADIPGVDPNLVSLDIYAPKAGKQHPVVVMIHGGGWRRGDKANPNVGIDKANFFVPMDYVFVSINYRLSPAVKHPAHVQDVAAAISWIHDRINQYGGDKNHIYLIGHSAGAHLAALVATNDQYLNAMGKNLSAIKGVILLDSAGYDLNRAVDDMGDGKELRNRMYEESFGKDRKLWTTASPTRYVASNKGIPPFLIFYNSDSRSTRITLSNDFAGSLRKAGVSVKVVSVPGKNHQAMNSDVGNPGDILTVNILEFLKKLSPSRSISTTSTEPFISEKPLTANAKPGFAKSDDALSNLRFSKDYFPGARDRKGNFMGGTETNAIVTHEGQLYAAISYWNWDRASGENPGAQILVKRTSESPWEVDVGPGTDYLRFAVLRSVNFTTDGAGKKLDKPIPVLLAGANWQGQGNAAVIFAKEGRNGSWKQVIVTPEAPRTRGGYSEVRVIFDHIDRITGIHYIFATVGDGLYRGVYDPAIPERIRWESNPEMRWSTNRLLAAAEANGSLYVTVNVVPKRAKAGGLFKRLDGSPPSWEQVYEWQWSHPNREHPRPKNGMRGLTAVTGMDGHEFLLGAREHPGVIERIDPKKKQVTPEIDVRSLVRKYWMSGKEYLRVTLIAYNDMLPVRDPDTGMSAHLIGLWINPDVSDSKIQKSSWYLTRSANGQYSLGRVFDPEHPDPEHGLRGTRTICASPFPEEKGKVFYFGGFDATGGPYRNTAWIYKAELPSSDSKE